MVLTFESVDVDHSNESQLSSTCLSTAVLTTKTPWGHAELSVLSGDPY